MAKEPTFDFVVAANRLPVDREVGPDGSVRWRRSPGGLVTAMESVMRGREGAWVGWAGFANDDDAPPTPFHEDGMYLHPLALSQAEVTDYYEGFSNDTLWPIYHDVIVPPTFKRRWRAAYDRVNERFAKECAKIAAPNGVVWVHDYQLQQVPAQLRALRPDLRIGWFNHIPFPPVELFMQLPRREHILHGLLGADFLGFQRKPDAANFLRACRALLPEVSVRGDVVHLPDRRAVRAAAVPISIDVRQLRELATSPAVAARAAEIRDQLGNPQKILLGVDRLDYTKGIRHRIKAYGELLASKDLDPATTMLVQVATPSRERLDSYRDLRVQIEQMVGRINGDYSPLGSTAVTYLHRSFPREEMAALFSAADVMLVTPLRDGMNLVAKEFVACNDGAGALVLSEFTGAADELAKGAYLCNPHDIDRLKATIMQALTDSDADHRKRMSALRRAVNSNDVQHWAETFLAALKSAPERPGRS